MNEIYIASIFGLITLALWGSGAWFLAESSKRSFNSIQVNFAVQFVSFPISIGILIFSNTALDNFRHLSLITLESIIYTLAFLAFIKALSRGPVGVVLPLQSIYPLYLLLFSIIFLGQKFNLGQILPIIIIVSGVFLVAYEGQTKKKFLNFSFDKKMAILSGALWGLGNLILNSLVDEASWQTIYVVGNISIFFIALLLVLATSKNKLSSVKKSLTNRRALFSGLIVTLGSLSYILGATLVESVVIIISIASAEPLAAALLSRIFDKEILSMHKRVGAVMIVTAIILLNVYGQ